LDSSFRPLPGTAPWSIKPAQIPYSPLNGAYVTADDGTDDTKDDAYDDSNHNHHKKRLQRFEQNKNS
jgi:hypothetical protein